MAEPTLYARMELRLNDFEKKLAKATKSTDTTMKKIDQSSTTMRQRVETSFGEMAASAASFAKGLAAPLLALGAAGIVQQVGAIANSVASVGDEAARAGVAVEALQDLGAVARANRVPLDALVDGLKELSLRGDEFVFSGGKSGSAAEAFQRLGYSADELKDKLKAPSDLFTEIIGKLGHLDRAAQIRLADEIFGGTGGERFVQLIGQGEAGLRSTIQTARDLGQVMDAQVIAKANDLDRAFNDVSTTVGTNLQQAIINASWALFDFLQQFKAMEDRTTSSLEARLDSVNRQIVDADRAVFETRSDKQAAGGVNTALYDSLIKDAESKVADLRAQEASLLKILTDRQKPVATPGSSVPPNVAAVDRTASTRAALAEADAVLRLIEAKEFELSVVGLSARELAVANALRDAGAAATDKQRGRLTELVTATFDATDANDRMTASLDQMASAGESALSGFLQDIASGKDAGEAFLGVLGNIGSQLLNMGVGGLGSLFKGSGVGASLFGGFRESGGPVQAGKAYVVGEKRPELFVPGQSGRIVPHVPPPTSGGGRASPVSVPISISIDARGADEAGMARVSGELAQLRAELPGQVKAIVRTQGTKWR